MLIHDHLPKTAGTTFNFGIAPQLIPTQKSLLVGTEMPIKTVDNIKSSHLKGKKFLSGHGLSGGHAPSVVEDLLKSDAVFVFGFARSANLLVPSMLGQVLRRHTDPVDYERINSELDRMYKDYFSSANFLLKQSDGILLKANSEPQFYQNLQILNERINLPVCYTPARNRRAPIRLSLDRSKLIRVDSAMIDEIFSLAMDFSQKLPFEKTEFDYVIQTPQHFEPIQPILGSSEFDIDIRYSHILWLRGPACFRFRLRTTGRVDKSSGFDYFRTGRRRDLDAHEPQWSEENLIVPPQGIGFSLRYPFASWWVDSNRPGEVIGDILRFKIQYA